MPGTDELEELEHDDKILVDRMFHLPGKLNTADIATCQCVEVEQIAKGTEWQEGPVFLKQN